MQDILGKRVSRNYMWFQQLILHQGYWMEKVSGRVCKIIKMKDPDLEKKWEFMAGYLKSEIKRSL